MIITKDAEQVFLRGFDLKIAIVVDQPRSSILNNEEGFQEDQQSHRMMGYIKEALSSDYEVICLTMDSSLINRLHEEKVDLVFNLCNGIRGEASLSQLPAILEYEGIPYTGSSTIPHGLAYNKIFSGKIFKASDIPTPEFIYISSLEELEGVKLDFPILVKPKDEGSSRGIQNDSLTFDLPSLKHKVVENLMKFNPPMILSEYIEGREYTAGILGNGSDLEVLPILEVDFSALPEGMNRIYSFEAKFAFDESIIYHLPARVDKKTYEMISDTAVRAFRSLGMRDYARVDMRVKGDKAYVIEINSLPGLDKYNSDIIKMAKAIGMDYDDLIKLIVNIARKRLNLLEDNKIGIIE